MRFCGQEKGTYDEWNEDETYERFGDGILFGCFFDGCDHCNKYFISVRRS